MREGAQDRLHGLLFFFTSLACHAAILHDAPHMPLRTVLVRPHSPGNVGACARASKAFGATLVLVSPRVDLAHPDLLAFASGAEDLVASAPRFETLEELAATPVHLVALSSTESSAPPLSSGGLIVVGGWAAGLEF